MYRIIANNKEYFENGYAFDKTTTSLFKLVLYIIYVKRRFEWFHISFYK